jgi:hypothetical protein
MRKSRHCLKSRPISRAGPSPIPRDSRAKQKCQNPIPLDSRAKQKFQNPIPPDSSVEMPQSLFISRLEKVDYHKNDSVQMIVYLIFILSNG